MADVVGIFDRMADARASAQEVVREHIAPRQSIELVEPDQGQENPEVMTRSGSTVRMLSVFAVAACITVLLSLVTLTINGFGFALAALALFITWYEKRGSGHLLLQHRKHISAGRTLLIVSVADGAVSQVIYVFRKYGAMEVSPR